MLTDQKMVSEKGEGERARGRFPGGARAIENRNEVCAERAILISSEILDGQALIEYVRTRYDQCGEGSYLRERPPGVHRK